MASFFFFIVNYNNSIHTSDFGSSPISFAYFYRILLTWSLQKLSAHGYGRIYLPRPATMDTLRQGVRASHNWVSTSQ